MYVGRHDEPLPFPPRQMYRVADYRCEGRRGCSNNNHYAYRWVDPTFDLEERIEKLEAQARKDYRTINRLRQKINPFDDGMGGW